MDLMETLLSVYLGMIAVALLLINLKLIEIKDAMNRIADAMGGGEEDDEE